MVDPAPIRKDFLRWFMGVLFAPVAVMLVVFFISWILRISDVFVSNFGAADALPIAAMILITLGQDMLKIPTQAQDDWLAIVNVELLPYLCGVIWLMYGSFKISAMRVSQPLTSEDHSLLSSVGIISLLILACVFTYGLYLRFRVMQLQLKG